MKDTKIESVDQFEEVLNQIDGLKLCKDAIFDYQKKIRVARNKSWLILQEIGVDVNSYKLSFMQWIKS